MSHIDEIPGSLDLESDKPANQLQKELVADLFMRKEGLSEKKAREKANKIKLFSEAQRIVDMLKVKRNSPRKLDEKEELFMDSLIDDEYFKR